MKKIFFLFFQLLLLPCFPVSVSQLSFNFMPFIDQLPSNSVQRIFQDKMGFMWFGTMDGICRYDGYHLLTFRSDANTSDLLTNNEITCIAEDSCNYLWIGTKKGLNLLNKETYQISHLDLPELRDFEIKDITVSTNGSIWVGTQHQLIRFNADHSVYKKYDSSLPISSVNSIYEDKNGDIWVALWTNGLYLYDKNKDTFIRLPRLGATNNPFRLFHDREDRMWIASWGDGLFLLEKGENNEFSYYKPEIKWNVLPSDENRFFSIVQDKKYGYLWIVSLSGLYAFSIDMNNVLREVDISVHLKGTNNIFSEIIEDKKGNLWTGTFSEGVFTINFDKPVIHNYPMTSIKSRIGITPNITVIYEDINSNLWFNQNRYGLGLLDKETNLIYLYQDFPDIRKLQGLTRVSCISGFRSLLEEIWIGSTDTPLIYSMKKDTEGIRLLRTIDLSKLTPQSGNPRLFFEDRRNNIWIVTSSKIFIKPNNTTEIEFVDLPISFITGITEDTKGSVWISTSTNGLYQIDMLGNRIDNLEVKHFNSTNGCKISDNVETISGDMNGNVWIGTKEGNIIKYDMTMQSFFDLSSSFKMINEGILNIITDEYGHIWISTNKRVVEYNPQNNALIEYSNSDGILVNSFLKNSYYKNNFSKIILGGNNGISEFTSSKKLSEDIKDINTYITDIKIENKSVFSNNKNNRFNVLTQAVEFGPKDKNIEIDFSSLDYIFPEKIQYAYKMTGVDDDWVYTKNNRQFATYNQLKKGSHVFQLKTADEKGLWTSNVVRLNIRKQPNFYETWGAYTFYCLVLIVTVYFVFRIVHNRIKLRNEFDIARIEKEKSEELIHCKLRYFTNISHDFMTPLTIVSCLLDDVEMITKDKIIPFEAMRINIKRLQRLLQQVLDFRKMESGNMKLKLSYGDIVLFIRDICSTHFELIMQKKNIKFFFSTNRNQIQAFFDPDKIDKIIFNLLSNAYKYTPVNGEIKVEIELQNNRLFMIRVRDTGIGMSKKEQKNIFTRFYTDSKGYLKDSNGIGLSLTKDLLDLHHGSISVDSELNEGTVFTITFPIDRNSYSAVEMDNSTQMDVIEKNMDLVLLQDEKVEENNKKNEKIENEAVNLLLVEDNEELLNVLSNILSKYYNIFKAANGAEALGIVKKYSIGIIVSDVMMPEMDGLELSRTLKNDLETSHIPILLLTAKNSVEDRIECYNAGADGYISKPFELKVLEARINNFITYKKERQKIFKSNVNINISTLEYPSFDEQFLANAIKIIEMDLSSDLDVNTFSEKLNMSKSSLYRKIKAMTGFAPNEFIRNIRLKHACQMLKNQSVTISEIAYAVGFSDPKYFTFCFKNEFNMTPYEYRNQVRI